MALAVICGALTSCADDGVKLDVGEPVEAYPRAGAEFALWSGAGALDIASRDGSRIRRLSALRRAGVERLLFDRVAWSPDGTRIAFTAADGIVGSSTDVWVVRADDSRLRRLTRTGAAFAPVWAPDGHTIVYAQFHQKKREAGKLRDLTSSLWAIDADGSNPRRLTESEDGVTEWPWSFLPDGSELAITRTRRAALLRKPATSELVVLELDGSGERELTDAGSDPAFAPDGSRIAFVSTRDRNGTLSYGDIESVAAELYVMDADGANQRRLTRTAGRNEQAPSWAPNGARIAYHRGEQTGNAEAPSIWQVNPDGSCATEVLADARLRDWYASPVWRPARLSRPLGPLSC